MCTYSHLCVFVFVCFGVYDNDVVKVMRTKLAPNLIDLCNLQHQSNLVMQMHMQTQTHTYEHRHIYLHTQTQAYIHRHTHAYTHKPTYKKAYKWNG